MGKVIDAVEVGKKLDLTRASVYRLTKEGRIPATEVKSLGGNTVTYEYDEAEIDELARRRRRKIGPLVGATAD